MGILVGIVLAPLAGLIGTLLIILLTPLIYQGDLPDIFVLLPIGTFGGSLYAAPTTLLVLPLSHYVLKRTARATTSVMTLIGFFAGSATMAFVVWWTRRPEELILALLPAAITLVGGVAGAISGLLFSLLVSRARSVTR